MLAIAAFYDYEIWQMDVKLHSLMDFLKKSCIWCNQKVLLILKVLTKCQAPAIHLWTSASISELEYTLWWVDQSIWFYTDFWKGLYLQESVWEHYNFFDKYMWMTYHYEKRHIPDILGRTNFFFHTYDTSMTIIVPQPGIIIDVVGSYFYDKKLWEKMGFSS